MEKVILFGNGSVAQVLYVELMRDLQYEVAGFAVDPDYINEELLFGRPVIPFGEVHSVFPPQQYKMMIAVGYARVNKLRAERFYQAKEMGYRLISYLSPRASLWPDLKTGENCKIWANTLIQPFAQLGDNVFIGGGCTIGHHVVIKDHCFLAGGVIIGGSVTIEPYSFIGTGAIIRNRITIARESVVGAGSVILADTQEKGVYMARPAEQLPISSDQLPLK